MTILNQLIQTDVDVFVYLNGLGNENWDGVWNFITHKFTWIPLYILLLYFIRKYSDWKTLLFYSIALALLITVVDQSTTHLFKNIFQRLRPSHNTDLSDYIRITGSKGGYYGFVSAHASNTFAIAIFLGYQLRQVFKNPITLLLIWAVFVSYSRIYVGKHYPGDLIGGAIWGMVIATIFLVIVNKTKLKEYFKLEKNTKS